MNPFRSKRLLYRAPEDNPTEDAFIHTMYGDPLVGCMVSSALQRPLSTVERKELRKEIQTRLFVSFVICKIPEPEEDTAENEPQPIGEISLKAPKPGTAHNRCLELGISIATKHQGQGYGTEAISWLLDWSFLTAGLHRVELTVFDWNERARKVYERIGFVQEGIRRESIWKDGRWWDLIQMGILEHEWAAKKKAISS